MTSRRFNCLTIAFVYFVVAGLWTNFSHLLFAVLLNQPSLASRPAGPSHWFFVAASTGLLYWLLRYWEAAVGESQESLRKVNRALRSFSECSKAMTRADDEMQLMQAICRICVEVGGHRMAWVAYGEDGPQKALQPMANWGAETSYLDNLQATWADGEELGSGPAGTSIRTGQTTIVQNLQTDQRFAPWREAARNCGYASCVALPLVDEERGPYGALVIFDASINAFDKEEVELLEELAGDLSYGLKTLRLKAKNRREMEDRLMLATVMDQTSVGVITFTMKGTVQYVNPSFVQLSGIPAEECRGTNLHEFEYTARNQDLYQAIVEVLATNKVWNGRVITHDRDGAEYDIDARIAPVFGARGAVNRYVATLRNVSQEVALQRQLRQAQKMEALATLSGGIAHDFNNILAIIMTNVEMTLEDCENGSPEHQSMELALKAALRGKTLIKQFLTISRQNEQPQKPVAVGPIVDECLTLLRATLPTTIELRKKVDSDLPRIGADPTQIHQVFMNLCTNAADAMNESGGVLDIEVTEVVLKSQELGRYPGLKKGRYVKIILTDSGEGMSRETLDRIFDPFFTTKTQAKGTGLGLSIAHGIIKNHGGSITVHSLKGVGTSFTLHLPVLDREVEPQQQVAPLDRSARKGHLLFVDDEEDYARGMKMALERLGYSVTIETEVEKTLVDFRREPDRFDLLITDQTMPYMTGIKLTREIHKIRPELPVILCSGSSPETDPAVSPENARAAGVNQVLVKPVEKQQMHAAIQQLL
jgi:PAS domain S-box-containing protein